MKNLKINKDVYDLRSKIRDHFFEIGINREKLSYFKLHYTGNYKVPINLKQLWKE